MAVLKTPVAAQELGISYFRLISLMRLGHVTPPGRDSSGHFAWTAADMAAVRKVLAARGARKEAAQADGRTRAKSA